MNIQQRINEAATSLALGLDGTYGKPWKVVADDCRDSYERGVPVYVNGKDLQELIEALQAGGFLKDA